MNRFDEDLLAAYTDGLVQNVPSYGERLYALFPDRMAQLAPLIALTEYLFTSYEPWGTVGMPGVARAALKERLMVEMARRQGEAASHRQRWQWAALGASFTVAGALAARAWWEHSLRDSRSAV